MSRAASVWVSVRDSQHLPLCLLSVFSYTQEESPVLSAILGSRSSVNTLSRPDTGQWELTDIPSLSGIADIWNVVSMRNSTE